MTRDMDTDKLDEIIGWLTEHAGDCPTLLDMADADSALMYLRHLRRRLGYEVPK